MRVSAITLPATTRNSVTSADATTAFGCRFAMPARASLTSSSNLVGKFAKSAKGHNCVSHTLNEIDFGGETMHAMY